MQNPVLNIGLNGGCEEFNVSVKLVT